MTCFRFSIILSLAALLCASLPVCAAPNGNGRSVTDMRGKSIALPDEIKRVATIDDGFIEGVMTHLGVIDKVAAIGSWSLKRDYRYSFRAASGEEYEHSGLNTMKFLHPWLDELPCVNSPQGNILNYEALAAAGPDLVILRLGDCTVSGGESAARSIAAIESLGLPLVVLLAPGAGGGNAWDLSSMREEMGLIGEIFGQREKALELADLLAGFETMIRERSSGAESRPDMLYLGLEPALRQSGGAGMAMGVNTPESYIIEEVAQAANAFRGLGNMVPLSAEQILALAPDVILLPTWNGYHPPRELYESPEHALLQNLEAVREKRVYALPWTPMNCARRLEYPLDMLIIAKAAHPELFADINAHKFARELYQSLYGVDAETAEGLAGTQMLDWMLESGF